jgi:hypothetical protein
MALLSKCSKLNKGASSAFVSSSSRCWTIDQFFLPTETKYQRQHGQPAEIRPAKTICAQRVKIETSF